MARLISSHTSARLHVSDLTFEFPEGRTLFSNLSFSISSERIGLVGDNGAGKSTLLKILSGDVRATRGHISVEGTLAYLPQDRPFQPHDTVATRLGVDEVLAAIRRLEAGDSAAEVFDAIGDRWTAREEAEALLTRVGLPQGLLFQTCTSLSGGERTRVELAARIASQPDILILDEPSNHMDADGRQWLHHWMRNYGGAVLVASHDRELLREMDAIWELSPMGLKVYGGSYDFYCEQKQVEEAAAHQEFADRQKELKRVRRDARAVQERQNKRRAQGRRDAARGGMPRLLLGLRKRQAERTAARLYEQHERRTETAADRLQEAKAAVIEKPDLRLDSEAGTVPNKKRLLELIDVNVQWSGSEAPLWKKPLNALVCGPRRIALMGANGSGKTTLIRLLTGAEAVPHSGQVGVGTDRIVVLDQTLSLLNDDWTVLENLRAQAPHLEESMARTRLSRALFTREAMERKIRDLSGGEKLRATLAALLAQQRPPELLLLDEPTNHLDIRSMETLENLLRDHRGAMIVISHDLSFLEAIEPDVCWILDPEGLRTEK